MQRYTNQNELYHHGIKGQKWGVRRYQNKDGSLTNAGKRKYDNGNNKKEIAKKAAAGAAVIGLAAISAYALQNENTRKFLLENSSKVLNSLSESAKKQGPKVGEFVKNNGKKAVSSLSDSAAKAGKAMTDAALVSIGTIEISKLSKKLDAGPDASEDVKNRNKVLLDTATAGINSITNANSKSSSNNSGKKGGSVGKDITDKLGSPSKKGIDKGSSEYQNLFKDSNGNQRDPDTRSTIKSLASAGYDIDQIRQYVDTLSHSMNCIKEDNIYIGQLYISNII